MTYATIGTRAQRVSQLAFLRLLAARPGVSGRSADAVGRRLQDRGRAGRARGSRACRAPITGSRSRCAGRAARPRRRDRNDAARADPGLRRAGRASRRRALSAAVRHRVDHAALRRARAGAGASAGRSREGQRHRDDLHVRRHHRRDLVARAEPAGARRHPAGRHAARRCTWGAPGWESVDADRAQRHYDELARLSAAKARAKIVEQLRESAISSASRGRSRTP